MKKFTALFLCFLLLFFAPSAAYASTTGSVVVTGGSIGSGGLSGGYSQKSESSAITLTMALMYSLGITVKLSQDAINAGESAYSYVKGKFYEWVGGTSAEQMTDSQYEDLKSRFSVINGGSNVDPDGKIYLNGTALDMIRRFLNWLKGNNYINNGSGGYVNETVDINSLNCPMLTYYNVSGYGSWSCNDSCALVWIYATASKDRWQIFAICNKQVSGYRILEGASTSTEYSLTFSEGNYYFGTTGLNRPFNLVSSPIDLPMIPESYGTGSTGVRAWLQGANGDFVPESPTTSEGFNYDGNFDPDTLNNPDGNQTVVDPPLIDQMKNQNPDADASIGVDKYLEALKQILNQITNPLAVPESVPAQDLPTLAPVEIPVPDDLPVAWPVELPSSPTATPDLPQDNTPVVDPSQPADPEVSVPEMSVHLEEYFPFCLPFDVYKIMQKFNGSPQAPEVHLSFDAPTLNLHIPLDLDFSVFDSVASVLRNGESILYVVGLCVVTRKTFLRA